MINRFLRGCRVAAANTTSRIARVRRVPAAVAAGVLAVSLAACSGFKDNLLEATDPDLINPGDLETPDGATALRNGALFRFRAMTAGTTTSGSEGTWLLGGLLADEW